LTRKIYFIQSAFGKNTKIRQQSIQPERLAIYDTMLSNVELKNCKASGNKNKLEKLMKCYTYQDVDALGICKSCNKAVCSKCAIDTGRGLACSEECVNEINDYNVMMDRGKRMYSIGTDSRLPPTGIIFLSLFGLIFTAFGLYNSVVKERVDFFSIIMGFGFLAVASITYLRNRKLKLNC
jgi:hypothetical protein